MLALVRRVAAADQPHDAGQRQAEQDDDDVQVQVQRDHDGGVVKVTSLNESYEILDTNFSQKQIELTKSEDKRSTVKNLGIAYVLLGWMFCLISFIFMPIVFGTVALAIGLMTLFERSRTHGVILIFFSISGLVLGTLFNIFVTGTMFI